MVVKALHGLLRQWLSCSLPSATEQMVMAHT